jgi:hypothetical protein
VGAGWPGSAGVRRSASGRAHIPSGIHGCVVIVDPVQYQRRGDERDDVSMPLRSLHFGPDGGGLVTFLVYPPDDLVLVVKIQWLGG